MLDCSSNGLVARMFYGDQLLKIKPWRADLAAPMLAHAVGGTPLMILYVMGLFAAALSTLAGMVFIMSANITRDVIKLWAPRVSDKSMLNLGYFLVALFLFLPFYWTLVAAPPLLAIFMGMAAMGLGAIFFFVTAISYYWKGATKWGAICTVIYGTVMSALGGYFVLFKKPPSVGMGTMGMDPRGWMRRSLFWSKLCDEASLRKDHQSSLPTQEVERKMGKEGAFSLAPSFCLCTTLY